MNETLHSMNVLPRIKTNNGQVHYKNFPGSPDNALCCIDIIGGKSTKDSVNCNLCISIVKYIHEHKRPEPLDD